MSQCKLKRQIKEYKLSIGSTPDLGLTHEEYSDPILKSMLDEFWNGSLRYGNKRKYEAGMKVNRRNSDRMKLKESNLEYE